MKSSRGTTLLRSIAYVVLVSVFQVILLALHIPEHLGEDAAAHWANEQIADRLGIASPTIEQVTSFILTWAPPALLALVCLSGWLFALRLHSRQETPTPEPRLVTEHVGPATIQSGETRNFNIDLKRPGPVDLIIGSIVPDWTGHEQQRTQWQQEGRGNTPELFVNICSAEEGNSRPRGVQKGSAGSLRRELRAGPATIGIFNFRENPPVTFSATIRLPE